MARYASEKTLAAKLAHGRAQMFVGRAAEKQLFETLLTPDTDLRLLFVHGIGGIGKTTLLNEFERLAAERALATLRVNARDLPATPEEVRGALSFLFRTRNEDGVRVLLLDNFEYLAPLEAWFRDSLLPDLPGDWRVVIAGRKGPAPQWLVDLGWIPMMRTLAIDGFSVETGREYLVRRGAPAPRHDALLAFVRGHPLALALAADVLAHQADLTLPAEAESEILNLLMTQLLRGIDDLDRLQALRAAAVVRELSEPLLAHMLRLSAVGPLFDWLQGLSFVQASEGGLTLHSLLRDALTEDSRRRDPFRYHQMAGRAYRYLLEQMAARPPAQCGPATVDVFFVQRDTPLAKTIYRFEDERQCYCDAPAQGDWGRIQDMVLRHEGAESLAILRHWKALQPEGLVAVREAGQRLVGFLLKLELNGLSKQDAACDPVVLRYLDYLGQRAPMAPEQHAILFRSWMAEDSYQALSPVQTQVCAYILFCTMTAKNLAYILHIQPDVDAWTKISAQCGQTRLPGAAVTIGRYRAALYAHDYREQNALQWMCGLHRILRQLPGPAAPLDEASFVVAAKQALKDYVRVSALAENPLVQSALLMEQPQAVGGSRGAALQAVLRAHCERLRESPKTAPLYQVLHRTYLEPARNQELAAEALYLTERTYRRRLAEAVALVAASLWAEERAVG